jgi:hypothetical protein
VRSSCSRWTRIFRYWKVSSDVNCQWCAASFTLALCWMISVCIREPHIIGFFSVQGVRRAVDLCAAPGSWSQVLAKTLKWVEVKTFCLFFFCVSSFICRLTPWTMNTKNDRYLGRYGKVFVYVKIPCLALPECHS